MAARMQESWFARYHWPDHSQGYLRLIETLAGRGQEPRSATTA
jgi:hypothetical protein